jgi:hypothetical protein
MNAQLGTDLALASRCVAAILPPRCRVTRRRGADWTVGGQSHSYTVLSLPPPARLLGYGFLPVSRVDLARMTRQEAARILRDEVCNRSADANPPLELLERTEQILASRDWLAPDEVGELSRVLVAPRIVKVF